MGCPQPRLNRTSVGLKLHQHYLTRVDSALPQSNQRGIETEGPSRILSVEGPSASIEPAWD